MKSLKEIVILTSLLQSGVGALAGSNDEAAIRSLYGKLGSAMKHRDISAVEALEASGFSYSRTEFDNPGRVDHTTTFSADKANKMLAKEAKQMESYSVYDFKVTHLQVQGNAAHVSTEFRFVGRPVGEGKVGRLEIQAGTEDDLVKTSKGWLFKTIRDTRP